MKLYFDDENFDGQLQRSVGKCDSGMANAGECLYIASQIPPGDRNSWYQQWSAFADKLVQQANTALAAGHTVSARGCYLRAAEYYRQAFFWHRPFPTILHIGGYDGTAEENFASASAALDRGWAFASLDGPGTGIPLYERREPCKAQR